MLTGEYILPDNEIFPPHLKSVVGFFSLFFHYYIPLFSVFFPLFPNLSFFSFFLLVFLPRFLSAEFFLLTRSREYIGTPACIHYNTTNCNNNNNNSSSSSSSYNNNQNCSTNNNQNNIIAVKIMIINRSSSSSRLVIIIITITGVYILPNSQSLI